MSPAQGLSATLLQCQLHQYPMVALGKVKWRQASDALCCSVLSSYSLKDGTETEVGRRDLRNVTCAHDCLHLLSKRIQENMPRLSPGRGRGAGAG